MEACYFYCLSQHTISSWCGKIDPDFRASGYNYRLTSICPFMIQYLCGLQNFYLSTDYGDGFRFLSAFLMVIIGVNNTYIALSWFCLFKPSIHAVFNVQKSGNMLLALELAILQFLFPFFPWGRIVYRKMQKKICMRIDKKWVQSEYKPAWRCAEPPFYKALRACPRFRVPEGARKHRFWLPIGTPGSVFFFM